MPENTRTIQDLLAHLTLEQNNEENVLMPILTSSASASVSASASTAFKGTGKLQATKLKTPRKMALKRSNRYVSKQQ